MFDDLGRNVYAHQLLEKSHVLLLLAAVALIPYTEPASLSAGGTRAPVRNGIVVTYNMSPNDCRPSLRGAHAPQVMRLSGGSDVDVDEEDDEFGEGGMGQDLDSRVLEDDMVGFKDQEAFDRAKDAARKGDTRTFEEIKAADEEEHEMTPGEILFWRMERYAKPWPPDWLERMQNQSNPVVFLDVAVRALDRSSTIEHEGRITIELFEHKVPKTAENFRCFCTGEVLDPRDRKAVGYKNTLFHRIVHGFLIQGGDFVKFDGTGSYSIFGGLRFADEDLSQKHFPGAVSMANAGTPDTNGCQFFIVTCEDASFLDGKHVIVGQVLDGMDTVTKIEEVPVVGDDCRPLRKVIVEECGQLV